jgi:CHAT domain-containing protein
LAAGADALVYLVPGTDNRPGFTVTIPATGLICVSTLVDLRVDEDTPVGRYASSALRSRDMAAAASADGATFARSLNSRLDDVGAWAWRVAVAGVVEQTMTWHLGRPANLVLVPVGELALVPWHAAYGQRDGGRRYAVLDIAFSYSPSARMFCAAAHVPSVPIRSALVVGDPGGDLAFAGMEARAVHEAFYPYGRYLGNGAEAGSGTRSQVLDWVKIGATGASMLHLACHGRVEPGRPAGAALMLADGPLAALDIVEATRLGALVVNQVFLAACTTSDVGRAYDEAFSLASAFLAAGARTVFGSMWAVPDAETSLLMFMVHHYLVVEGRRPADSLHAAQLWMLDPARRAPASMPPDLAAHSGRSGAADPIAWAAFTHLGW